INLLVTFIFQADVGAQGGAYATGVLVLMSSACLATIINTWRRRASSLARQLRRLLLLVIFSVISLVFFYTTIMIITEKPSGIIIGAFFIVSILFSSILSRFMRSTELRFEGFDFVDDHSRFLWASMK